MEVTMKKSTTVNMVATTLLLFTCKIYVSNEIIMLIVLSHNELNPIDNT